MVPRHVRISGSPIWRTLTAIAAALAIAACGSDGTTPTAPTPKTASVASVAVTGSPLAVGATGQFIATATLSDGSTQNVTTGASWASSNPNVASVTNAGVVNAQTAGDADITATYNGVSGKTHVLLVRPPSPVAVISGTVTDGFSGGILPNISVQLVDTTSVLKSTRTDASGKYLVANVATGPLTVSFSAKSYVTLTKSMAVSADTRIDGTLQRAGPISGPALLTLYAPVASVPCPINHMTDDVHIAGTQIVDEQQLTFVSGTFTPQLTLSLTKTGGQLAGQIVGVTTDLVPRQGVPAWITVTEHVNVWHPASANGGIGPDGRASGIMIGTIAMDYVHSIYACSGTFAWALTDQ